MSRSGVRTSWLVGLGLGVPAGFLLLEVPYAGLTLVAAMLVLLSRRGNLVAGFGGHLTGIGLTGLLLLGRVKLTCHPDSCTAPTIDGYLAVAIAILALGLAASMVSALQARNA